MEIPVNLVLKRFGANVTIPLMVVLWGLFCACQGEARGCSNNESSSSYAGAVTTYGGLIACRFFLGMAEGTLRPCFVRAERTA